MGACDGVGQGAAATALMVLTTGDGRACDMVLQADGAKVGRRLPVPPPSPPCPPCIGGLVLSCLPP